MFGTVARLQVKPDAESYLFAWLESMEKARLQPSGGGPPRMVGWLSTTVYRSDDDPNVYWMAVVFESREAYRLNAEHPNQDREYRQLRSCLEADPEWFDGDVVAQMTPERSYIDHAGHAHA